MNDQQVQTESSKSRHSRWQTVLEKWKNSGLSQARFCRDNGLNTNTFQYWKKKLISQIELRGLPQELHSLIPVSVIPKEEFKPGAPDSGISLKIEDNLLLQFNRGFCPSTLLKLVETLRTR